MAETTARTAQTRRLAKGERIALRASQEQPAASRKATAAQLADRTLDPRAVARDTPPSLNLDGPATHEPQHHDVSGFDCGSEAQTRWLRQIARTAQVAGTARVYLVTPAGSDRVVGYHALAVASVSHEDAPPAQIVGARAPVIHVESEQARAFYLHLAEFDDASRTDPLHLVLLMTDIARKQT